MRTYFSYVLLGTIIFFNSCAKSAIESDSLKKTTFTLKGNIILYDEGQTYLPLTNSSGMTVTVENSNPLISAVTNSSGEFELALDTSINSFTLVYTKPLYGTFKRYYEKVGANMYALSDTGRQATEAVGETLAAKSTVTVNSLSASIVDNKIRLKLNASSPDAGEKFIRLFYQKNQPGISFATVPKTLQNMSPAIPVQNGNNVYDLCADCLYQCPGLNSGDTVYLTAYGDSWLLEQYTDRATNQVVMPNVNTSNNVAPVSFIVP